MQTRKKRIRKERFRTRYSTEVNREDININSNRALKTDITVSESLFTSLPRHSKGEEKIKEILDLPLRLPQAELSPTSHVPK